MSEITKGKSTNDKPETPRKDNKTTNEVTELKAIVESLQSKVTTLEKKVGTLETKVEALESTLLVSQNTSDKLSLSKIWEKSQKKNLILNTTIHRHGKVNGTKQNVIAGFRSHQYPSDLYYSRKKNKNRNIRLKPSLTKKRTELLLQNRKNRRWQHPRHTVRLR